MIGSTASEKQEREDLLDAITRLKDDLGAVDDVVKLLTHVVEKGKLPQETTSSSRSGSASGSSSSSSSSSRSSDSPDNDDDGHEENNNDNKKVTLEEALQLIEELTPQKAFASMEITGKFRGANGLKSLFVKNGEKCIDTEVRKMTDCKQIDVEMPRVQRSGKIYFDDKSNTEEAVLDALLQAKAIESKPLNKHRVKGALEKAIKRVLSSGSEECINYTPGLVTTEPKIPNLDVATDDCTKAVVLVVAGESGSGKSRYAVGALAEGKTALLRYSLRKDDFDRNEDEHTKKQEKETENEKKKKQNEKANKVGLDFNRPTEEKTAQTLRALIDLVTSELFHYDLGQDPIYESIRSVAKSVNKNRNTWAFKKAKEMIEVAIENVGSEDISRWYKYNRSGEKATVKLDKLVIILTNVVCRQILWLESLQLPVIVFYLSCATRKGLRETLVLFFADQA